MYSIDKSTKYQPNGPAKFTQMGWYPVYSKPVKVSSCGEVLFNLVVLLSVIGGIALIAIGYFN